MSEINICSIKLSVINAVKDENGLNKEIIEKLKLTIEFYKEKDEKMIHELNVIP